MLSTCDGHPKRSPDRRWKRGAIPVIGVTGVIGGGKSRLSASLARRGAAVIDADAVGHQVLERPEVRERLVGRFGAGVLRVPDSGRERQIDRKVLGAVVFADSAARRDLESIVHPEMLQCFETAIERAVDEGRAPAVVLDAAVLFEAGWNRLCDLVVFVDAPFSVRLERVSRDRGWTAETLRAREAAQWPAEAKAARADVTIHNESSVEALERSADSLLDMLNGGHVADCRDEGESRRAALHSRSYSREGVSAPAAPGRAR